ncbi:hypothetical protein BJ742DRAFT_850973 [Cladochytrium replicatum]|nr:hypothetical protein BJ742DRAFT_850973 [Cladochytrium replicatum]
MTKKPADLEEETEDLTRRTILTGRKMVVNSYVNRKHCRNRLLKEGFFLGHLKLSVKRFASTDATLRLQNEMVKIKTLLSKHANVQAQLEENNLGLEQEFRAKLKNIHRNSPQFQLQRVELDAIHRQDEVDRLTGERERALAGILESTTADALGKKIRLAKETKAALDPTVGATERENLIVEMEKSVERA